MPDIVRAENAAGDVAIGFEAEGTFIPVAVVQAHRIQHLVERDADLKAKVKAGGLGADEAQEVLDAEYVVSGKKKSEKEASS